MTSPVRPFHQMRQALAASLLPFFLCILATTLLAAQRETTTLEAGWRFKSGECAKAEQATFDDTGWQAISIPHSWGWEDAHQGKNYYRGPGWYRLPLKVGTIQEGKRYFLRFEAAGQIADVYLNGKQLGSHRGGFGAFCFEVTNELSKDGANLLAVRVSNEEQPDIAPLSGDFSVYGGLYRPVQLIVTNEQTIALTDHGSPGVAWLQSSITAETAVIDVTAQVSNAAKTKQARRLTARVLDAEGREVVSEHKDLILAPSVTEPHSLRLTLQSPHLWNGRKDPYLYHALIELSDADGRTIDSLEQPLGLRFYTVDPDKGFFLNGKPYHLHGANRHQDRPEKGWAITRSDMEEDLALMLEMGCNLVRCAHYQHSDEFYSLCDKAGLLVWAEIPQVNEVHSSQAFATTSAEQLRDLIRQNVNHPSIFAWSLFNEIWPNKDDPHRLLQDLNIIAKGEDPTRPTIAATSNDAMPQMNRIADLLGWNIYTGWYLGWGTLDTWGASLDKHRHDSKNGGYMLSEYGAGANVAHHEIPAKSPVTTGPWHPEEWQCEVHEAAWAAIMERPYVWASCIWVMFDFAVSSRHEGGIEGLNNKGMVTYDRKTRKDAFYFYKANWSDEPVLYIASRRFTERIDAKTDIKVYSNAAEVELLINGISQGRRSATANGTFVWKAIELSIGENKVEAHASRQGQKLSDSCIWILKAAAK